MSNVRIINLIKSFFEDVRGVSAVEFGIVAPVFFAMIFGVIEISRIAYAHSIMKHAIQEVSRDIMVDSTMTTADMETNAKSLIDGLDKAKLTLNATEVINGDGTDTITFSAVYVYELVVPMVFESPLTLNVQSKAIQPSS